MLRKLDSGVNEFTSSTFKTNTVKVTDYHRRATDGISTIQSDMEGIQFVLPNSSLERFQHFQQIKNKASSENPLPTPKKDTPEPKKEITMTLPEKDLERIPKEVEQAKLKIAVLDLSKNKFQGLPSAITQMLCLRSLKMSNNKLKAIPEEISRLINLEHLYLSFNLLESLPLSLAKLTKLRTLDLEANVLTSIGDEVTNLKSLQSLNISNNMLEKFPCSFKDLTNLVEFHFDWLKYTFPQVRPILKGKEGERLLQKLRSQCKALDDQKIVGVDFEKFSSLLSYEKVDMGVLDTYNRTFLHIAVLFGDISVINYLCIHYPELIDLEDQDGMTAFCLSLMGDKDAVTRCLLKYKASPFRGGGKHGSPLHIATKRLKLDVLKEILQQREDPNRLDAGGNSSLHYAINLMVEGHAEALPIVQCLLDQGANPNTKNRENWTPLHLAVRKKSIPVLEWIISHNFEVQEIHGRGEIFKMNKQGGVYLWSCLHIATYSDCPELVNTLGQAKIDPFKRSLNGFTAKRIVKRFGVTLKLTEKYETEWVKKNVLKKKQAADESAKLNTENLGTVREIKNASKNIFGEVNIPIPLNHPGNPDTTGFGYVFKTRVDMHTPQISLYKPKNKVESFEVIPETETCHDYEISDSNAEHCPIDQFSEADENNDLYELKETAREKTNKMPDSPKQVVKQFIKGKFEKNNYQSLILGLEDFRLRLSTEKNYDIMQWREEIKFLAEKLISDKIIFSDKLKALNAAVILHEAIISFTNKEFNVNFDKEAFSFCIRDHLNSETALDSKRQSSKSKMSQLVSYYEIVPKGLISVFEFTGESLFEDILIKQRICVILGDLKYFPGMAFLQDIVESQKEGMLVLREAYKTLVLLQTFFSSDSTETQFNQACHTLLKGQYAKVPSTKQRLLPMQKLEKDL